MADYEVNKRLKYLIKDVYNMTPYAFSQKYGDKGGVKTSRIITERNGVSSKMVDTILGAYPEINKIWLLTGEGKPFKINYRDKIEDEESDKTCLLEDEGEVKFYQTDEGAKMIAHFLKTISSQNELMKKLYDRLEYFEKRDREKEQEELKNK